MYTRTYVYERFRRFVPNSNFVFTFQGLIYVPEGGESGMSPPNSALMVQGVNDTYELNSVQVADEDELRERISRLVLIGNLNLDYPSPNTIEHLESLNLQFIMQLSTRYFNLFLESCSK
jgi:hypothetical protein